MRTTLHTTHGTLEKHRRHLARLQNEVQRKISQDLNIQAARRAYKNAKRKHMRARSRFQRVTEGFLGPEPPPLDVLSIVNLMT